MICHWDPTLDVTSLLVVWVKIHPHCPRLSSPPPTTSITLSSFYIQLSDKDLEMQNFETYNPSFFGKVSSFMWKCLFSVLSFGPMPNHIAFIMDGNQRYAKSRTVDRKIGYKKGFSALFPILRYSYEMGVKYVTVYAVSIDNFKRPSDEVQTLMDLMKKKIDELLKEVSIVRKHGIRINFWGDLKLLKENVREAAEKAMAATAENTGPVFSVCIAYTFTCEITHAVQKFCSDKRAYHLQGPRSKDLVSVANLEQHLYSVFCPEPDIVIRTSSETRLSNFLLWQTTYSHLQNPVTLWPEFSLRHLVWTILQYQRVYPYLQDERIRSEKSQ